MFKKHKIPAYFLFRIIIVGFLLYGMLVFPYFAILRFQQFSQIIPESQIKLIIEANKPENKSKIQNKVSDHDRIESYIKENEVNLASKKWYSAVSFISLIVVLAGNWPIKRYFRRKRRNKPISAKLQHYTEKYIRRLPVFNSLVIFIPMMIAHLFAVFEILHLPDYPNSYLLNEKKLHFVQLLATVLVGLFVFFWQKNRLRFEYLEHVYSLGSLRKISKVEHKSKISTYFLTVNMITILFPVIMVIFYLSTTVTQFSELNISELNEAQRQVLFNEYFSIQNVAPTNVYMQHGMFINADNFIIMLWGLVLSTVSALVFLFFFINWTTRLVVKPVNELLSNMQATGSGQMGIYGIVRSNDEIGRLSAEYNIMSERLKSYFDEVNDLNKNLEKKVIERTKTIHEQKEEIESQRDDLLNKNTEIETQNEEIKQQRDLLFGQKKEITDSIFYAQRIQQAVMPENNVFSEERTLIFFKPRDIVSGDFYYFGQTDKHKVLAAVDCTGHGVPGAFMSMLGISFLNEILKSEIQTAAEILEELRREVKKSLGQYGQNARQKDGMDMALCLLDEENKVLHYAGAYNPLIIIRNKQVIEYKAVRNPVGIYIIEKPFENITVQLQSGDMLYVYSDGYVDQFGGKYGKKFKSKHFKQLLSEIADKPISRQKQILNDTLNDWQGNYQQTDDIIVLGIRIS